MAAADALRRSAEEALMRSLGVLDLAPERRAYCLDENDVWAATGPHGEPPNSMSNPGGRATGRGAECASGGSALRVPIYAGLI
jgi:hypothetical protein